MNEENNKYEEIEIKLQKIITEHENEKEYNNNKQTVLQGSTDPMDKVIDDSIEQISLLIDFFDSMKILIKENKKKGIVFPKEIQDSLKEISKIAKKKK